MPTPYSHQHPRLEVSPVPQAPSSLISSSLDSYETSLRELALQEKRLRVAIGAPVEASFAGKPSQPIPSPKRHGGGTVGGARPSGDADEEYPHVQELLRQLAEAKKELAAAKAERRVGRDIGRPGLTLEGLAALEAVAALDVEPQTVPGSEVAKVQVTLDLGKGQAGQRWFCMPRHILGPRHPDQDPEEVARQMRALEAAGDGDSAQTTWHTASNAVQPGMVAGLALPQDVGREESLALLEMTDLDPEEHEVEALKARLAVIEQAADQLEQEIDGNKKRFQDAERLFFEQHQGGGLAEEKQATWASLSAAAAAEYGRRGPLLLEAGAGGRSATGAGGPGGSGGADDERGPKDKENEATAVNRALGALAEDAAAQELADARALLAEIDSELQVCSATEHVELAASGSMPVQVHETRREGRKQAAVANSRWSSRRPAARGQQLRGAAGRGPRRSHKAPQQRQTKAPWVGV